MSITVYNSYMNLYHSLSQVGLQFFFVHQETPDKLVGVHCTHGLNRTGYLVCRYMIQELGVEPEEAIAAFDTARGHSQVELGA